TRIVVVNSDIGVSSHKVTKNQSNTKKRCLMNVHKIPGNRTGMKLHAQVAIYRPVGLARQARTPLPNLFLNVHKPL
ncbi:MAG: hypothetical protein KDE01_34885, partial [Caldilineaceae bacterium]|nr:hypothetical protein [Caldilineaceae bacterium]